MSISTHPGRRAVLLLGAAGLLGACTSAPSPPATPGATGQTSGTPTGGGSTTGGGPPTGGGSTTLTGPAPGATPSVSDATPTPTPTASPSRPAPPAGLPNPSPWAPNAGDVRPEVKVAAVGVVEAILGYPLGGGGPAAARARVEALGQDGGLVDRSPSMVGSGAVAAVQVVDAQYGGILASTASVLVVCRQWVASGSGQVVPGGTTVDVRLVRTGSGWRVTELHPAAPGPASGVLSAAATQVLASSRIVLPPASVADIRSGQVHDSVLRAMLSMSSTFTIGVSVVRSGHPTDVFGTNRPSDHPQGRAFDTWQVDGRAVVDRTSPRSLVTAYMQAAAAAGSYNVGGPYLLGGSTFFSDDTHHDHVHAGFRS